MPRGVKSVKNKINYRPADPVQEQDRWCGRCPNHEEVNAAITKCVKHGIRVSYFGTCDDRETV